MGVCSNLDVAIVTFGDYATSVAAALDAVGAKERLPREGLILLKPNLTNASPPPVTTPVACVEAVLKYCRAHSAAEVAIAEGCGSGHTADTFEANGYTALAQKYGLRLIDCNEARAIRLTRSDALYWKELFLPAIVMDAFLISIPVLKDHSFTGTTVAMKNMFGLAPAPYYRGSWNKSRLHAPSADVSVVDVCLHRKPDLCVVDAVVALAGMHLSGTPRRLNRIVAGFDPVAVDSAASALMGHDPRTLEYLRLADGRLGRVPTERFPVCGAPRPD